MEGKSGLLLTGFLAALIVVAACDKGPKQPDLSKLGPSSVATVAVLPVGSEVCPKGGIHIYAGVDTNDSGILDAPEAVNDSPICSDLIKTKKPNGYITLMKIESEPTGTPHCPAGGLKILSGADTNKNSMLDPDELVHTEYVCNGAPGPHGAAGIMVEVGSSVVPPPKDKNTKKNAKSSPAKTKQAASDAPAPPKKVIGKVKSPDSTAAKAASPAPVALQGWTSVDVQPSQLATVAYKIDGKTIIVRFTNLSDTSPVRFKYTVRWQEGQNGVWANDSTMEGISFRLKPHDTLDREIRTHAQEVKDVVVELDVHETTL